MGFWWREGGYAWVRTLLGKIETLPISGSVLTQQLYECVHLLCTPTHTVLLDEVRFKNTHKGLTWRWEGFPRGAIPLGWMHKNYIPMRPGFVSWFLQQLVRNRLSKWYGLRRFGVGFLWEVVGWFGGWFVKGLLATAKYGSQLFWCPRCLIE